MKKDLPEGLILRGRTYWAEFRHGGRRVRKSLSKNLKTAKQLLVELQSRAERGDYGLIDNEVELESLKVEWLKHCRQTKKPGTVRRYEYSLAAIVPGMPNRVSRITVQTILAYRSKRLDAKVSPRTINMDVGALSALLQWSAKHNLIGSNPLAGLEPLPHDHPKEGRALERHEVESLLAFSPPPWRDIWYAFLVTGIRKNELASLKFTDIDWKNREVIVQRGIAKNHEQRRIPVDDELYAILEKQQDGAADRRPGVGKFPKVTERIRELFTKDHVFTTTQNTPLTHGSGLYHALIRCCKAAGISTRTLDAAGREIDHVDVHSLRRTFATDLIENNADPKTVQTLLGHKTLAMTMGLYAKIRRGTTRQAVARLSYGSGAQAPEHLVEFPESESVAVHKMTTIVSERLTGTT